MMKCICALIEVMTFVTKGYWISMCILLSLSGLCLRLGRKGKHQNLHYSFSFTEFSFISRRWIYFTSKHAKLDMSRNKSSVFICQECCVKFLSVKIELLHVDIIIFRLRLWNLQIFLLWGGQWWRWLCKYDNDNIDIICDVNDGMTM